MTVAEIFAIILASKGNQPMTKKELVELLNANFADNEEVFVRYDDDQGECVGEIKSVEDVTQNFIKRHFQVLNPITDEWEVWPREDHPTYHGYKNGEYREIIDREWSETKKCICVE